jgi:tetratricopeptide (TPR) repeat protein
VIWALLCVLGVAPAQDVPEWAETPPAPPTDTPVPRAQPRSPEPPEVDAETEPPVPEEDPADAVLRAQLEVAVQLEAAEQWGGAVTTYRSILNALPDHAPAVMGLGRSLQGQGNVEGALAVFARLPEHPEALDSRAFLLKRNHPLRAAELYRRLQTLRPGDPWPYLGEAQAMLGVDPVAAADAIDGYLTRLQDPPKEDAIVDIVGALRGADRDDRAETLMVHCLTRWPDSPWSAELSSRLDRMRVERKARELGIGGAEPLSADLREQVEAARSQAADGDLEGALDELREVVRATPRSAEAWAAIGDLHAQMGAVGEAERAFGWAAALEPDEATWHVRLGMLLTQRYGGKRDREARDELRTALSLRPSWSELHFQLARIHQQLRDFDGALASFQSFIEAQPDGKMAERARTAVADLSRRAPPPMEPDAGAAAAVDIPEEALTHYRVARIYRDQDDLERSKEELAQALTLAPDWTAAINLRAALAVSGGDEERAIEAWEQSLAVDPSQSRVRLAMGELHRRRGEPGMAATALLRAARDGAPDAHYVLADMAYEKHDYRAAEQHLSAFFSASTGGLSREPAMALRQQVRRRLLQVRSLLGAGGLLIVGLVAGFVLRRRSGKPIDALIAAAPEAAHDIARVISAIRHELLKHNTSLLSEMAVALEHGDDHAVSFGADRLFGGSDRAGVVHRFQDYLSALKRLGRRHGVRLDLRRRDPVFGPMGAALHQLRQLEGALRRPPRRAAAREDLSAELDRLSDVLNVESYRALGAILQRLGTLHLDNAVIASVDARVRAEPVLAEKDLPALDIETPSEPVPVRMFRGDLDDVMANLLRNAYQAVTELRPDVAQRVGVAVRVVVDPITGIETVQIRFRDTAPGGLTNAMLLGRGIGRGLGLTVDLVARHEGTIHIEPERGWSKAVVVSLRRSEQAGVSDVVAEE